MEPKKITLTEQDGDLVATPENGEPELVTSSDQLFEMADTGRPVEIEIDGREALDLTERLVLPDGETN